jgi:hypothetical protein
MPSREPSSREPILVKQFIVHQLMTLEELSVWLRMSEKAIAMQVTRARRGKAVKPIPFYQPGGKGARLRFDYDEIREWMRGGRESA